MTVIAIEDIKDFKRNIMAKKGNTLKVTADYWNVWIVEDNTGNRFAVNKSKVLTQTQNKDEKTIN